MLTNKCVYCGLLFISKRICKYCCASHKVLFFKKGSKENIEYNYRFNIKNNPMKLFGENFDTFFYSIVNEVENKKKLKDLLDTTILNKVYGKVSKLIDTDKIIILNKLGYELNCLIKKEDSEYIIGSKEVVASSLHKKSTYEPFSKKYAILRRTLKLKPITNEPFSYIGYIATLLQKEFIIEGTTKKETLILLKLFCEPEPTKINKYLANRLVLKGYINSHNNTHNYTLSSEAFEIVLKAVKKIIEESSQHLLL